MDTAAFGVSVPATVDDTGDGPVERARAAERLGFDFVSTADHPCGTQPTHEAWTMLTWSAASTTRIGVLTRVLGVPYRPPAMVAKMAETLDRLSGGRLVLGLGGGYSDEEFRAFGLPVPSPREKVDGLREAVVIAKGMWAERDFSFTGSRYHVSGANLEPKPARQIPIWLGTFGDRALAVTGRVADGWIPSLGYFPPDRLPDMRDKVHAAAIAAGRTPEDITCGLNVAVHVGHDLPPSDDLIAGTPDQIIERLAGYAELGFTAFNFLPRGPEPAEQVRLIASEVVPALRET